VSIMHHGQLVVSRALQRYHSNYWFTSQQARVVAEAVTSSRLHRGEGIEFDRHTAG